MLPDNTSLPEEPSCFGPGIETRLLLAPLALAALALALAASASLGFPLRWVAPAIWASLPWIGLALLWVTGGLGRGGLLLGALAILSAWLVLVDVTGHARAAGVLSYAPDAWSYQSLSDFLYHYSRGKAPLDMPLIDQFGARLGNSRFGAPSLLAFLGHTPFLDANAEAPFAQHAYCTLCLAVHFCSFAYLMRALSCRWHVAMPAAVLATAGGWLTNLIIVGNYDNLLFIALAPAWLGLATRFHAGTISGLRFAGAGALCLAALFYIYPEGFLLVSALSLPLLASLGWGALRDRRRALALAGFAALFLLLAAPYAPTFCAFAYNQIRTGTQSINANRPGIGIFPGLLRGAQALPAAFALGDEAAPAPVHLLHSLLALSLLLLAATGTLALRKAHPWFAWAPLCVAGLWFWQAVVARYDYGTYKVIACASWSIYAAVGAGAGGLLLRWGRTAIYAGFALLLFAIGAGKWEDRPFRAVQFSYDFDPIRELDGLDRVIGHAPILLAADNDFEFLWACVFLRRYPLQATQLRSYMRSYFAPPSTLRIRGPAPEDCHYELISGYYPDALWHNSRFSLLPIGHAKLDSIENPNGVETAGGEKFIWLSSEPTVFTAFVLTPGDYELDASAFGAGLSVAPSNQCPVEVEDASGRHVFNLAIGPHTAGIPLYLARGENRFTVRGLAPVTIARQANGDARPLLLGVLGPRLVSRTSTAPTP